MYKKVLFTQFAIPSYDSLEYRSNVHLAAGYLLGYVKDSFPNTDFIVTPRIYTDVLAEKSFIDYVLLLKPDLMVFSLYLWNIEKSFRVVELIKGLLPETEFIFGGPEVNPDNDFLLNSDAFSQGIVGEGEIAFSKFLAGKDKKIIPSFLTKEYYNSTVELRNDYKRETNPYLHELIEVKPDNTLFFETVRGCPFSCNFCYYNKVYDKVVPVGHDQLEEIFIYAKEHNFEELFLLDPTFNIQPKFDELLDKMIKLNSEYKFRIATELRADFLSDVQIEKLKKLNLVEAEIGLQTSNPISLKAMNRKNRTKETIERTKRMLEAGIDCKVDLIIGLPGDTLSNFKTSVDDVVKSDIGDSIQVFKLSLLSGTEFSKNRGVLGLIAEAKPPYYLKSTPSFSSQDMREAIDYVEQTLDITLYPMPGFLLSRDFTYLDKGKLVQFESDVIAVHKLVVESRSFDFSMIEDDKTKLCETLVVHYLMSGHQQQKKAILESLNYLMLNYPNNKFQFILDFRIDVDLDFILQFSQNIAEQPQSYLERDAISNLGGDYNLSAALAIVVPVDFRLSQYYSQLKEQCEIYLNVQEFNYEQIDMLYEDSKIYFSGDCQKEVFEYLEGKDMLDEFTIFDSYRYEMMKGNQDHRIYTPKLFHL